MMPVALAAACFALAFVSALACIGFTIRESDRYSTGPHFAPIALAALAVAFAGGGVVASILAVAGVA